MAKSPGLPLEAAAALFVPGRPLLGLDPGTKTIGVALSDTGLIIASAYATIARAKFREDGAQLIAIAEKFDAAGWLVGLPLNMDGSEGPRAQSVHAFVRNLAAISPLPIAYWDERLSTAAAERVLLAADASRRRRAQVIDKAAAAYILQGALDRLAYLRRA
jgi:putative holliday junction resolvase